MKGSSNRCNY